MLQIIIFSFNRAIQLDALLTSLEAYWQAPQYQVDVVYNTSSQDFQKGYELLMKRFAPNGNIAFHKEEKGCPPYSIRELVNPYNLKRLYKYPYLRHPKTNFRPLTIQLMASSKAEDVMFMTDDSLFISNVDIAPEVFDWLHANPKKRQFSLRIGKGMNHQPSSGIQERDGILSWNMNEMTSMTNWSYLFSVDAHIYNKKAVLDLFKLYNFCNPNSLEGYIYNMVRRKRMFHEAKAFVHPHLLSFPINMVQNVEDNESLGVSTEMMNKYYLDGYKLKYQMPEEISMFQVYPEHIYFVRADETITVKTD